MKNTIPYHLGLLIGSIMMSFFGAFILHDFNADLFDNFLLETKNLLFLISIGIILYGSIVLKNKREQ